MNAYKDKMVYHIPLVFDEERHNRTRRYEAIVQNGTLILTEKVDEPKVTVSGGRGPHNYPDYP